VDPNADTDAQRPAFISVIVLLLGAWNARRSNVSINIDREMGDVRECLSFLQDLEERWNPAGRVVDVLNRIASVGDLSVLQPEPHVKRPRDRVEAAAMPDVPTPSNSTLSSGGTPTSHAESPTGERAIAGSGRVRAAHESRLDIESMDSNAAGRAVGFFSGSVGGLLAGNRNSDATLPLNSSKLGRMNEGDPLLRDPSVFSSAAPFTPLATFVQPDVQLMDSVFNQNPEVPDPASSSGAGFAQEAPVSNVDLGALFGFGGGAQQPMVTPAAPPLPIDFVFGAGVPAPGSIEELLQGFGSVPDGLGGGMDLDTWTELPIEYVHFVSSYV
jgi:hypothetical protein